MLDLDFMLTDTPSGPPGNYTDALTLTLGLTRAGVDAAPSPVWFEVLSVTGADATGPTGGVYDRLYHDIVYVWEFDDAANAVPSVALNMPDAWKDINRAYGREVAHVYNDPGTYTVRCTAYETATRRKGTATIQVTVGDPDVVFPTGQTIIYDPNGTADTTPYPGADVQTTWAGVNAAKIALGFGSPARILMAPGSSLIDTAIVNRKDWANIRVGALDPNGVKPIIGLSGVKLDPGGIFFFIRDKRPQTNESICYGISFVGAWDSTSETGMIVQPFLMEKNEYTGTHSFAMHRCDFDGFRQVVGSGGIVAAGQDFRNVFSECSVTNWQNYGIFGGSNYVKTAVIGCSVAQHVDALSGGPKNGLYNNHGSIRDSGSNMLFISVCDLFSRAGWSTGGTDANGYGITADQACLRVNTSGHLDRFSYTDRVTAEGVIWIEEQDRNKIDVPGNHVFDKILQVIGSRTLSEAVECRYGGCTFRNYLGVKLGGVHAAATNSLRRWFLFANQDGTAENGTTPIQVYNTTLIDLRSDADTGGYDMSLFEQGSGAPFTDVTVENNINHQPNRGTPVDADTPIDITTAIAGFSPRHKGPRYNFLHESGTLGNTVTDGGGTFTLAYADVRDTVFNTGRVDNGSPTDQAYWSTLSESSHRMRIKDGNERIYSASSGHFSVTYDATEITITNTSGVDWGAGARFDLRLDRRSRIQPFDPALSSLGKLVPTGQPQAGSKAIDDGDMGLHAYDDFLGNERPATGNERGARLR